MGLGSKVAVVTGAGSGIGRACAVALASAGAAVVANDVAEDGLEETVAQAEAAGGTALAAAADVRQRDAVAQLVERALSTSEALT